MTPRSPTNLKTTTTSPRRTTRSRTNSQLSISLHHAACERSASTTESPSPPPKSPPSSTRKSTRPQSIKSHSYQPSPLNMVTTSNSHSAEADSQAYYTFNDYYSQYESCVFMDAIPCDDSDFMFGGEPICAGLEDYTREQDIPVVEDRRGRTLERQYYVPPEHHYSSKKTSTNSSNHRKQH